jgi:hypothetical protein
MAKSGSAIGIIVGVAGVAGLIGILAFASKAKGAPILGGGPGTFSVTIVNPPPHSITWNATWTLPDGTVIHPSNAPPAGGLLFATGVETIIFTTGSLNGKLTVITLGTVTSVNGSTSITATGLYSVEASLSDQETVYFDCTQYHNQIVGS